MCTLSGQRGEGEGRARGHTPRRVAAVVIGRSTFASEERYKSFPPSHGQNKLCLNERIVPNSPSPNPSKRGRPTSPFWRVPRCGSESLKWLTTKPPCAPHPVHRRRPRSSSPAQLPWPSLPATYRTSFQVNRLKDERERACGAGGRQAAPAKSATFEIRAAVPPRLPRTPASVFPLP